MQLLFQVVLLAASAVLLQPVNGEAEGHIHLRVAAASTKVGQWQQCKWINKKASCDSGLTCVVQNDYYGSCMKNVADAWGQCGGYGWTGKCVSGYTCEWKNYYYSQCVPTKTETVAKWGQCHFDGYDEPCEDGTNCNIEDTYTGHCVPKVSELGEQCGGTLWSGSCRTGTCVIKSNHYSVCE